MLTNLKLKNVIKVAPKLSRNINPEAINLNKVRDIIKKSTDKYIEIEIIRKKIPNLVPSGVGLVDDEGGSVLDINNAVIMV